MDGGAVSESDLRQWMAQGVGQQVTTFPIWRLPLWLFNRSETFQFVFAGCDQELVNKLLYFQFGLVVRRGVDTLAGRLGHAVLVNTMANFQFRGDFWQRMATTPLRREERCPTPERLRCVVATMLRMDACIHS
jgi:hypothetical protein